MASDDARIVRFAELEIDPAHLTEYRAILAEEIEASVALEPGVLALNAVFLKDCPEQIRILEIYASQKDYETHLQTEHFVKYKTLTSHMVKSLRLVEVNPLKMCAKPVSASAE
jgi:quinol monooxygenase YgiN